MPTSDVGKPKGLTNLTIGVCDFILECVTGFDICDFVLTWYIYEVPGITFNKCDLLC